jgi:hypothetical protein
MHFCLLVLTHHKFHFFCISQMESIFLSKFGTGVKQDLNFDFFFCRIFQKNINMFFGEFSKIPTLKLLNISNSHLAFPGLIL